LQVSSEKVGRNGFVIGIDLKQIKPIAENTRILVGDVLTPEFADDVLKMIPRKADVILSDLAPDVTGVWQIDHLRQIDLVSKVVDLMPGLLHRGGSAVMKVFEGEETNQFYHRAKGLFEKVFIAKPPASRGQSSEMYLVALGYRSV
jgi:23S rRNA (uridine2552-2'-O)-methyltransferase